MITRAFRRLTLSGVDECLPRPISLDNTSHILTRRLTREVLLVLALSAVILAIWWPRFQGPLDLRWDGATYYVLGTSLAEGKGYRLLNEPGEIQAIQYPPLLPALIAAHQVMLGTSDPVVVGGWLRVSFFIMYAAFIFSSYALLRRYLPDTYAFPAILTVALNFLVIFLSDLCFAEIPFALVTVLFVLCNARTDTGSRILTALLGGAAYLLRTAGIALFVAWIAESLFRKNFRTAAVRLLLALVPVLGWQAYISVVQAGAEYRNPAYAYQRAAYMFYNVTYGDNVFSLREPFNPAAGIPTPAEIAARWFRNLGQMPGSLGEAVSAKKLNWIHQVGHLKDAPFVGWLLPWRSVDAVLIVFGVLVLGGVVLQLRAGEVLIPVYILTYLVAVCLTPWADQRPRYWAPVMPFLTLALFQSLAALQGYARERLAPCWRRRGLVFSAAIVGLMVTIELLTAVHIYAHQYAKVAYEDRYGTPVVYRLFFYEASERALDEGLDWLKHTAKPDDILAVSIMPQWGYLRTGLKTVMPPLEMDLERAQALLDSVPVKYLAVNDMKIPIFVQVGVPLVREAPERWRLVYAPRGGGAAIYERVERRD